MKRLPVYRAPWWLPGGHLQTIVPVARKAALPAYRRERWDTPDGDFIELDWFDPAGSPSADWAHRAQAQTAVPHADPAPLFVPICVPIFVPIFVLFHGLEGSSRSHYARTLMQAATARGWRGVVPNRQVQSQLLIARITTPNGAEVIEKFSIVVGGFRIVGN